MVDAVHVPGGTKPTRSAVVNVIWVGACSDHYERGLAYDQDGWLHEAGRSVQPAVRSARRRERAGAWVTKVDACPSRRRVDLLRRLSVDPTVGGAVDSESARSATVVRC